MDTLQTAGTEPLDVDEDFAEAVSQELARDTSQPKPTVRNMIVTTGMSLKRHIDRLRTKETELEATKAAATVEYERVIAQAKLVRDNCYQETDADLHQIRTTLEVLDPARAKLSEMA
ncbi:MULTISPECIES: hypothetical protein [unclassified Mesorhizobium]|uniref:hypothetical protein n=1 Tax=unclassified Mesorhizobium TaxID=325217 RepID=UPI000BAE6AC5|nr:MULTISPECIES: hypothetical protein [unclassified Mesorhizobium]TGV90073.1 hypothetical protein EN801_020685 [Mesorhizobium sp. M00.F.Ca.ET.158.01.1.1]MDG4853865.1 hypothetical protein [Mesorhizobium sp. WSM4982]MDG4887633.1 hypothetical protein [Mesorhizobium sp. WSM4887]MDG4915710.1 hypothetical protein [Mesorhizobium sp. WSM4983]PBB29756.1 hypothetical protein CK214_23575 [Mesorhizobium sp. WSM3882]